MNLQIDESRCKDLDTSSRLEWLETNGLGGFASGTVSGVHTRRYHGLLTSALHPPVGRALLVAKFEDTLVVDGNRVDLSANLYTGAVFPHGYEYLRAFRLDPFPTWVYEIGDVQVEKRVFMVHGQDATVVEYEVKGLCKNCQLEVRPLVAYRDYHATTHSNDALDRRYEWEEEGLVSVQPYDALPRVYFGADYQRCEPTGYWYNHFEYAEEKARGLDYQEDLFQPFVLHFDLAHSPKAVVIVSREAIPAHEATALRERERMRFRRAGYWDLAATMRAAAGTDQRTFAAKLAEVGGSPVATAAASGSFFSELQNFIVDFGKRFAIILLAIVLIGAAAWAFAKRG